MFFLLFYNTHIFHVVCASSLLRLRAVRPCRPCRPCQVRAVRAVRAGRAGRAGPCWSVLVRAGPCQVRAVRAVRVVRARLVRASRSRCAHATQLPMRAPRTTQTTQYPAQDMSPWIIQIKFFSPIKQPIRALAEDSRVLRIEDEPVHRVNP